MDLVSRVREEINEASRSTSQVSDKEIEKAIAFLDLCTQFNTNVSSYKIFFNSFGLSSSCNSLVPEYIDSLIKADCYYGRLVAVIGGLNVLFDLTDQQNPINESLKHYLTSEMYSIRREKIKGLYHLASMAYALSLYRENDVSLTVENLLVGSSEQGSQVIRVPLDRETMRKIVLNVLRDAQNIGRKSDDVDLEPQFTTVALEYFAKFSYEPRLVPILKDEKRIKGFYDLVNRAAKENKKSVNSFTSGVIVAYYRFTNP